MGRIKALGNTPQELKEELIRRLKKYIKNPIINIRIQNFTISVLGEVKLPGQYSIPNERVNILQAISMAGDFTVFGKRKDVLILRENENGDKEYHVVDFTSKTLLTSPYYYLKQNDVVIVNPNNAKVQSSSTNPNTSLYFSVITLILTISNLIFN